VRQRENMDRIQLLPRRLRERPASLLEESLINPVLLEATVSFSKAEEFALDKKRHKPGWIYG
jgi:hypothetical protein